MKRILCMILAMVMCFGLVACSGDNEGTQVSDKPGNSSTVSDNTDGSEAKPEFTWKVSFSYGENTARYTVQYLEEISKASGGRIDFEYYYSNSLITIPEIPKALRDGTADMSALPGAMFPDQLVYTAFPFSIPFVGFADPHDAVDAWWDMYDEFPEVEQELAELGIVNWYTYFTPAYNLFFSDNVTVETPEDLAGHKIMVTKPSLADLITEKNGAPLGSAPSDYYSNLEKAVADGVVTGWSQINTFGIAELIKSTTEFGDTGSHYDTSAMAISKKSWDKLPADIQQLFIDCARELSHVEVDRSLDSTQTALENCASATRHILTEDQVAVWAEALAPFGQMELQEKYDQGYTKIFDEYNFLVDWVAQHK